MTSSLPVATQPERSTGTLRPGPLRSALALLEELGEPAPEERFDLSGPDADRVHDAAATQLMDLFRRTADGHVFETLVNLVQDRLLSRVRTRVRFLSAALDPHEVLQDTLVNVYRYPDKFDGSRPGAFRAWSSTIVDNTIRRHLRKARSGPDVQLRPVELLCLERDNRTREPSTTAQQGEECRSACAALQLLLACYLEAYGDLTERERFVLQMVEVRGMRYAELARVLKIRPEALKMVVFRARKRIHERLTVMFARTNVRAAG